MTSVSTTIRRGITSGAAIKVPVVVATTANITLSGTQTIDGVAVVADDRVLVKDQADASENGIYAVNSSAWQREPDWDGAADVVKGTIVYATSGTTNQKWWRVTTANDITIGTTEVTIVNGLINTGQTYTPTNVSTDRSYDADSTTIAELSDVVGTLIADLQSIGVID